MKKNKTIISLLLCIIALVAGAVACGVISDTYFRNKYILEHGKETQAFVTAVKYSSKRTDNIRYYILFYEFKLNGIIYTGKTTDQYVDGKNFEGKYVSVTYLPDGRSCATDYDSSEYYSFIMALVFGLIAVIPILILIIYIVRSRQKNKNKYDLRRNL